MYEPDPDAISPQATHERLQSDWRLFSFDDLETAHALLSAVFGGTNAQVETRGPVRPRYEDQGAAADHASRWDEFCRELIYVNRYFPSTDFDFEFLIALVTENLRSITEGMSLFRGRVCPSPTPYPVDQMGLAPPRLVSGGRGNPVGIPHLYLASDAETCLKECRAPLHGYVSVAEFKTSATLEVLDLAELAPENPFTVPDTDDGNALVRSLVSYQFLRELGRELSIPTRPSENSLQYVPTQYLCELVKSKGVRGIRYSSSMHPAGWNLVLFHHEDALIEPPVVVYEVIDAHFEFEELH